MVDHVASCSLGYPVDAVPGAAGGTITGIEEASVRALAKLEQVLPSRLRHRVSALHSVTLPLPGACRARLLDPTWVACRVGIIAE